MPRTLGWRSALLASRLPVGPLEITALGIESCDTTASAVEARLVSPSASKFVLSRVPPRVYADRPLELELAAVGLGVGASAAVFVATWVSTHARLTISVGASAAVPLMVTTRPADGGWIARALIRPTLWADTGTITVVSLSLAGQSLPCDCLPMTLRVGYTHAPAPKGVVFAAVKARDLSALQAALESGGSTEEVDEVCGDMRQRGGMQSPLSTLSAAVWPHRLVVGRRIRRPPRGLPRAPDSRRQPGRSKQGKGRRAS